MVDAAELRRMARDLLALADSLDGGASSPPAQKPKWIDTGLARKIAGVESSSIYRWLRHYPDLGRKTPGGQWKIDETKLRALMRGELGEVGGELGEADPLAATGRRRHVGGK